MVGEMFEGEFVINLAFRNDSTIDVTLNSSDSLEYEPKLSRRCIKKRFEIGRAHV
jgi:hypothetical protein